jgi:hypothetical protein
MQTWLYRLPPAARVVITGVWVFASLFGVTQLAALQASSAMSPNSVAARAVVAAIGWRGGRRDRGRVGRPTYPAGLRFDRAGHHLFAGVADRATCRRISSPLPGSVGST